MRVSVAHERGFSAEYQNVGIQTKNNGKTVALYDLTSFTIVAEFDADRIRIETLRDTEVVLPPVKISQSEFQFLFTAVKKKIS